jgi:hypothetical protein
MHLQNVSLTKSLHTKRLYAQRLLNETSPVTKYLRHKTSPGQYCNGPDKLLYNNSRIEFSLLRFG